MTDDRARFDELLPAYWDGDLTPAELAEFADLLRGSADLRGRLLDFGIDAHALAARLGSERLIARPRRRWWRVAVAGAALAAGVVVAVGWLARPPAVAEVRHATGFVEPAAGTVRAGREMKATGPDSGAEVGYPDGTLVRINGDTRVRFEAGSGPTVALLSGVVTVVVPPQPPGQPMRLVTDEADVEVVGTVLTIAREGKRTRVGVTAGEVRVTRRSDRAAVAVRAGEMATVAADADLRPTRSAGPPDEVVVGLADGLPPGWLAGQFVRDGLSADSPGAVRVVPVVDQRVGRAVYEVRSHKPWPGGLVASSPDRVFEVRYQLAERAEVTITLQGRGADGRPTEARHVLSAKAAMPGRWTTARVPLQEFDGGPGLAVIDAVVVGTGSTDFGLLVDRLSATRPPAGGPK